MSTEAGAVSVAGSDLLAASPEVLARVIERERKRRARAELLLEDKSRELFEASENLRNALESLQRNQRQLVQQEKMASLGVMSAGVAHEINNPLGFVLSNINTLAEYVEILVEGYAQLREHLAEGPDLPAVATAFASWSSRRELDYIAGDTGELLRETRDGIDRVCKIVEGLKNFARADETAMQPVDVNEAVRSALTIARNQVKYRCEVVEELGDLPPVLGNPSKLGQVFLNLIVNASQAAGDNCWIRIVSRAEPGWVRVSVEDNGCGIPVENLDKVFTPFFTTKPVGVGTGLGLSISHGIITEHGGGIEVTSDVGVGTRFTVSLPVKA